ncbi:protein of unknown function [Cyanobium sp. NIES-981]|nr:protein of unknown function [Cyanobium sp. NIES-981]
MPESGSKNTLSLTISGNHQPQPSTPWGALMVTHATGMLRGVAPQDSELAFWHRLDC